MSCRILDGLVSQLPNSAAQIVEDDLATIRRMIDHHGEQQGSGAGGSGAMARHPQR